jgi:hypothetical protein
MNKHTRFYIDLAPPDAQLLTKLAFHLSLKRNTHVIRAEAVRIALRVLAKREKLAPETTP